MSDAAWYVRLDHILESIQEIEEFCKGYSYESFLEDKKTYTAVERKLEIIGEASKYIPQAVKDEFSNLNWREMKAMRNFLSHAYDNVELDILWNVVKNYLPDLKATILEIKKKHEL